MVNFRLSFPRKVVSFRIAKPMLRKAGYDLIIIEGKADTPVYIVIDGPNVELKEAFRLKHLTTQQKTSCLKAILGDDYEVACIGPAGEKWFFFQMSCLVTVHGLREGQEQALFLDQKTC